MAWFFRAPVFTLLLLSASLKVSAVPYESCTSKNDYLEESLRRALTSEKHEVAMICPQSQSPTQDAKPAASLVHCLKEDQELSCMATAMGTFSEKGVGYSYSACQSEDSLPKKFIRPCISENYVRFIHENVLSASNCVFRDTGIEMSEIFPLLSRESGFHVNVTSGTGCRGIGQLSSVAVREIDAIDQGKKSGPNTAAELAKVQECQSLKQWLPGFPPDHSKKVSQCEVSAVPSNPAKNLTYAFRLYRLLKEEKANPLVRSPEASAALTKFSLSDQDKNQLSVKLARTMYNGGYPGVIGAFKSFLKTLPDSQEKSSADPLTSLWKRFRAHLLKHYPQASNRVQVAEYADNVESAGNEVNQKLGLTSPGGARCFQR